MNFCQIRISKQSISKKFPASTMKSQWDAFIFWFILKTSEWLFKHGKKALEAPRKSENVDPTKASCGMVTPWPMSKDDMETATAHVIHVSVEDNRQLPQILHRFSKKILNQQKDSSVCSDISDIWGCCFTKFGANNSKGHRDDQDLSDSSRPSCCSFQSSYTSGWWLTYPSEKYEFVSWDDYSQYMEKWKMFQTTNQTWIILILRQNILECTRQRKLRRQRKSLRWWKNTMIAMCHEETEETDGPPVGACRRHVHYTVQKSSLLKRMLELLTPVTIANPATTTEDQCFGTISPASGDAHETDKKTKIIQIRYDSMTNWFELQFSMNSVNLAKRSLVQKRCQHIRIAQPMQPAPYPTVVMVTLCRMVIITAPNSSAMAVAKNWGWNSCPPPRHQMDGLAGLLMVGISTLLTFWEISSFTEMTLISESWGSSGSFLRRTETRTFPLALSRFQHHLVPPPWKMAPAGTRNCREIDLSVP